MIDPEQIARWTVLAAEDYASPGPWWHDDYFVCGPDDAMVFKPGDVNHHQGMRNAAFVAAAREALPALLAEREMLISMLKEACAVPECDSFVANWWRCRKCGGRVARDEGTTTVCVECTEQK